MPTKIEWADETWNPVRGCSLVSEGCRRCYAMKQAHRFSGKGKPFEGLTELGPDGPRWTGKIMTVPDKLGEPLHWKKPRRIFVNSMSDLFHEDVPDEFILACFVVMGRAHWHTYQILTKRPGRMHRLLLQWQKDGVTLREGSGAMLRNVWLGVSVEDQKTADERIPLLLQTPAAIRFVSYEPALGPVDFTRLRPRGFDWYDALEGRAHEHPAVSSGWPKLDWIICGGESGPGARPMFAPWARSVRDQCEAAGVAFLFKQWGQWAPGESVPGDRRRSSGLDFSRT